MPTPNESEADRSRRLRLIKESDAAKEKMLDKFVVPVGTGHKKDKAGSAVQ